MARPIKVERPTKKSEYEIVYGSRATQKGWQDLRATMRNALADTWDFLIRTPTMETATNYPLRGPLGTIIRDGKTYQRWQHKPTPHGDARIWFYIEGQTVHLEEVHTHHPNATVSTLG
jgi:hypothetical protein